MNSLIYFSHIKQDVASRKTCKLNNFRHEILSAGNLFDGVERERVKNRKTRTPPGAWLFMNRKPTLFRSNSRFIHPDARHGRERRFVPVHFHHDLSGHVGMLVVTQSVVSRHDGSDAFVLFQP